MIIDALFGILCLLHLRSFQRSGEDGIRTEYIRSGTEVLRNTLVYFQIACHERSLNGMPIVWVFLEQLIHCLYRDCSLVKESIVSRFLPFVEENLLYPPAQQSGLKKIIARRDANECTMEEDINAIPTFTFFEIDDYGGLMMSPSLIYSAITLLSSFDQFSILSKRSNVEEYNLLRCYVGLLLTVTKEQTAICVDEYTTSCPESKAFYVLECLMKLATTASNFDTDEVSRYLVLIMSTLNSSIQKLDLAQQGRDKSKWHISMQKALCGIIDIYYRSCSGEKFVEQAYTPSTISKICKANEDVVQQIQGENNIMVALMVDMRTKMTIDLRKRLDKLKQVQTMYQGNFSNEDSFAELARNDEADRVDGLLGFEQARRKGCERVWHKLLKKATSERAPWGTIPYRYEQDGRFSERNR